MIKILLSVLDFITVLMRQEDEMHKPNGYRENESKKTSTDTQTHTHTDIRTKRHMMKIIIDDFHHNKRYSIRDRHDENLGNKGEKTVIKSFN